VIDDRDIIALSRRKRCLPNFRSLKPPFYYRQIAEGPSKLESHVNCLQLIRRSPRERSLAKNQKRPTKRPSKRPYKTTLQNDPSKRSSKRPTKRPLKTTLKTTLKSTLQVQSFKTTRVNLLTLLSILFS
jgi:hypothetical protein